MDLDNIEQLLGKYWECETTVEEERVLKEFFSSANVPPHLMKYASMFRYFQDQKQQDHLDGLFDEQILRQLNEKQYPAEKKKGKVISLFYEISKVAAVILVVVTAGYFLREEYLNKKDKMQPYLTDTFEDPQKAFIETKKALMLISKNFNMGKQEMAKISVFNEATKTVEETEAL